MPEEGRESCGGGEKSLAGLTGRSDVTPQNSCWFIHSQLLTNCLIPMIPLSSFRSKCKPAFPGRRGRNNEKSIWGKCLCWGQRWPQRQYPCQLECRSPSKSRLNGSPETARPVIYRQLGGVFCLWRAMDWLSVCRQLGSQSHKIMVSAVRMSFDEEIRRYFWEGTLGLTHACADVPEFIKLWML